jgi:hypothetical protein
MDAVTLLLRAEKSGLRVERSGDKLVVRGPPQAEPVVRLLAEHKAELLAALTVTRDFPRVVPIADSEPSVEQPCAARRSRIQHKPASSARLLHVSTAWPKSLEQRGGLRRHIKRMSLAAIQEELSAISGTPLRPGDQARRYLLWHQLDRIIRHQGGRQD